MIQSLKELHKGLTGVNGTCKLNQCIYCLYKGVPLLVVVHVSLLVPCVLCTAKIPHRKCIQNNKTFLFCLHDAVWTQYPYIVEKWQKYICTRIETGMKSSSKARFYSCFQSSYAFCICRQCKNIVYIDFHLNFAFFIYS
jgi:hypothetical protein